MFYRVIDNTISEKYSMFLFDKLTKTDWKFVPNLSYGNTDNYDSAGFSRLLYLKKEFDNSEDKKTTINPEYNYVVPMILEAFDKFELNCDISNVFRSRVRLTLNKAESKEEDVHVDYNFPHLVLIYYINTTDGDTILYDNNLKILDRISPKRGRCVLFDGNIKHASSSSTLSPRMIINTNILMNER